MNRRALEVLQLRLEQTVARWKTSLRRFYVFRLAFDVFDAFNANQMSLLAASLSYYALLALFPLLLVLVSLASFFISESAALVSVMQYARQYLPGVEEQVLMILNQVIAARGPATFLGVVLLIWSASGMFDVLQQALDRAWRVAQPRAFWLQRLYSVGVIALLGAMFLSSIVMSVVAEALAPGIGDAAIFVNASKVFGHVVSLALSFVVFSFLYKVFPHARVPWRAALVSAAVVALLWYFAKTVYLLYLDNFARYNLVYGSLGAIIGLLFWGYITAMIVLLGAELSSRLEREKKTDHT